MRTLKEILTDPINFKEKTIRAIIAVICGVLGAFGLISFVQIYWALFGV
jgi:hypothetical protein